MAQGTPVVTSATTSTAEVGGDSVVLVDPKDAHALAVALDGVLGDPVLAQSLGNAGLRRAETYTWERTARLLDGIYREVAT
jgi:glycosyltransferase involved in cell wall biosynthesis